MARQKINPSIKIALGIGGLILLYKVGYAAFLHLRFSQPLTEIAPDRVNLIAVKPGEGYKIIVANRVAKLGQVPTSFGSTTEKDSGKEDAEATNLKIVPMKDLLDAMQGDEKALSKVVMRMNELGGEGSLPPTQVLWKVADLEKAFNGDATLKSKLEADLNMHLDGTPLDTISIDSIENGIVVQIPTVVHVKVGATEKPLTATVLQWYQPRFCKDVEKRYQDKVEVTTDDLKGIYVDERKKLLEKRVLDLTSGIRALYMPETVRGWAQGPERLLKNTTVLVNSSYFTGASYDLDRNTSNASDSFTLHLNLTAEGRDRLWKFSSEKPGFQLLFLVDGIAIAAPRIGTELSQQEVLISNMLDKDVLDDATSTVNKIAKK